MATIVRCDHCGNQAEPGHQWLRVRIEPFYPHRVNAGYAEPVEADSFTEGLRAEVCSPHCAAMALEQQATSLAAGYSRLAGAMARTAERLKEEEEEA